MTQPAPSILSTAELDEALSNLAGWTLQSGKLHRDYVFGDFITAFGFMTGIALIAQSMDHHPEWSNVVDRVSVDLSSHDAGGISHSDVKLANAMEHLASRLLAS